MTYLNKNVIYVGECESTNDIALQIIKNKKLTSDKFITIIASYQTKGRGQKDLLQKHSKWISEKYQNITMSIIANFYIEATNSFFISIITSLAIIDALSSLLNTTYLKIKWPNDIYYKNNKLGGILIENIIEGQNIKSSIIGIGLNVNQKSFNSLYNPTSIAIETNKQHNKATIIRSILLNLNDRYYKLKSSNNIETLFSEYNSYLYKKGVEQLFSSEGKNFWGIIQGATKNGELIINSSYGMKKYTNKQISFTTE